MNERDLILSAIKQAPPTRRRRKRLQELDPPLFDDAPDAISGIIKKNEKKRALENKRKNRPISQWTNTDFLRYLDDSIRHFGLHLFSRNARDKDTVGKIYDTMASQLQDLMDNKVFKEFFDWWVSSYASCVGQQEIHINRFLDKKLIQTFLSRFEIPHKEQNKKNEQKELDETTIFNMGGLSMLLVSKGIVLTYKFLRQQEHSYIFTKISNALRDLSKNSVKQSIQATLSHSPYNEEDKIDFVAVARDALIFHGLKEYLKMSYQEYFKQSVST